MLIREQILQALRSAKPLLESHGVEHVWLFGSSARDEVSADSSRCSRKNSKSAISRLNSTSKSTSLVC